MTDLYPATDLASFRLQATREAIPVPMLSEPDPSWKFVDAAGHLHAYYGPALERPTLEWFDTGDVDGYGEPVEVERCRWCQEVIRPGVRDGSGYSIPGPIVITGQWVTCREAGRTERVSALLSPEAFTDAVEAFRAVLEAHDRASVTVFTDWSTP